MVPRNATFAQDTVAIAIHNDAIARDITNYEKAVAVEREVHKAAIVCLVLRSSTPSRRLPWSISGSSVLCVKSAWLLSSGPSELKKILHE